MQSSGQIVTTNTPSPTFYRPDALPVAQPTVSKHWRETKTFSNANAMKRSSKHFEIMHTHIIRCLTAHDRHTTRTTYRNTTELLITKTCALNERNVIIQEMYRDIY